MLFSARLLLFGDDNILIFSYNKHIIRSDQAFQLIGQLTITAGLLDKEIYYTSFLYRCVKWKQNWRNKSPCYLMGIGKGGGSTGARAPFKNFISL